MRFKFFRVSLLALAMAGGINLTGCSSDSAAVPCTTCDQDDTNLFGVVNDTATVGGLAFRKGGTVTTAAVVSGCTVVAYDIQTNAQLGTGTTGADGTYTITGDDLVPGEKYKVVATCGSNKLSSIVGADDTPPASKEPQNTDPLSTLIAAKIIEAVVTALNDALSGIPAAAQAAIKEAILANLDAIVVSVTSVIEEAVASGSMEAPDITEATAVAGSLETVDEDTTDFASVLDGYTANNEIPVAVDQAVAGAAQQGSSLVACSTTLNASATLNGCGQAIAKLMFTNLGFGLMLRTSGGHFGNQTCDSVGYGAEFENAELLSGGDIPAGWCGIVPKFGGADRNSDEYKEDEGPQFAETGDLDGMGGDETGVLTSIAQALLDGNTYNLASIDSLVFDPLAMNMRLLAEMVPSALNTRPSFKYLNSAGSWVDLPSTCGPGNSNPCGPWDLNFNFGGTGWDSSQNGDPAVVALATAIGGGVFTDKAIFLKKFGGPVPVQSELDAWIDEGRTHITRNPSGEKEFNVLYAERPAPGPNGSNPCWDRNPATICKGESGTDYPALKVNLTYGATANNFRPITAITKSTTGGILMIPQFTYSGFTGVFTFRRIADGRVLRNDFLQPRGIKVILNTSECGNDGIPTTMAGCAAGDIYNVETKYACGSNGCDLTYTAASTTEITQSGLNLSAQIRSEWKTTFAQFGNFGHQLVGAGDWNNLQPLKLTFAAGAGADPSGATVGLGQAGSGEYNIGVGYECAMSSCTFAGFFLIDENGEAHVDGDFNANGTTSVCNASDNCMTQTAATLYLSTDIDSGQDFDAITGGTQDMTDVAGNVFVDSGPFPNPNYKCSLEPFFVDGNANGVLDCLANDSGVDPATSDRSFSADWEYNEWLQAWDVSPDLQNATRTEREQTQFLVRENGYAFADPVGVKKLLSTAFNGWFDGAHTISATTSFDALQVFALLFMFFEEGDGGGGGNIDGFTPSPGAGFLRFESDSPVFGENGGPAALNEAISHGIKNFNTN